MTTPHTAPSPPNTGTPQPPTTARPLIGIDGLRAFAALAVLGSHVAAHTGAHRFGAIHTVLALGGHGLTLFFVLSGFLLYRPFVKTIATKRPWPSLKVYGANRLLRIFPGYLAVLTIAAVILPYGYTHAFDPRTHTTVADTVGRLTNPLTLLADALLIQTFFPHTLKTGIGPAWSLTVELCFYALLPLVAWAGYRATRQCTPTVAALIPVAILFITGIAGKTIYHLITTGETTHRYLETFGPTPAAVLHTSIATRADLFATGMAVAVLEHIHRTNKATPRHQLPTWIRPAAAAATGAAALTIGTATKIDTGYAIACAALLTVIVTGQDRFSTTGATILHLRPIRYTGTISYSIYLWHVPVIWAVHHLLGTPATITAFAGYATTVLALTYLLSIITYHLVEAPALALKPKNRQPAPPPHLPDKPPHQPHTTTETPVTGTNPYTKNPHATDVSLSSQHPTVHPKHPVCDELGGLEQKKSGTQPRAV